MERNGFSGWNSCVWRNDTRCDRIERLRKEENLEPDCLVYFTDGDGEYPEKQPEYPVIFIEEKPCAEAPKWVQQIMIDK